MKQERIKNLLDAYYQGTSTEDEELELRDFFLLNELSGFEDEKSLFTEYSKRSVVPEPSGDFEQRIIACVNNSDTDQVTGNDFQENFRPWKKTFFINVAALVITIIGISIFFSSYNKPVDTYDDPAIAYEESIRIFNRVSAELNRGIAVMEPVSRVNDLTNSSIGSVRNSLSVIIDNLRLDDL